MRAEVICTESCRAHADVELSCCAVSALSVVFGWVAAAAILIPQSYDIFGISIPGWLMPFVELVVVSMFVPNASFIVSHRRSSSLARNRTTRTVASDSRTMQHADSICLLVSLSFSRAT